MPRPIHITTPIEPLESRIKRLRIPKARQKEWLAIMREPDSDSPATQEIKLISRISAFRPGENLQRAATTR
jgi:hypothetical protein